MSENEPGLRGWIWTAFVLLVMVVLAAQSYRTGHPYIAASVVGVVLFWSIFFAVTPDPPADFHHDHDHHHDH